MAVPKHFCCRMSDGLIFRKHWNLQRMARVGQLPHPVQKIERVQEISMPVTGAAIAETSCLL